MDNDRLYYLTIREKINLKETSGLLWIPLDIMKKKILKPQLYKLWKKKLVCAKVTRGFTVAAALFPNSWPSSFTTRRLHMPRRAELHRPEDDLWIHTHIHSTQGMCIKSQDPKALQGIRACAGSMWGLQMCAPGST